MFRKVYLPVVAAILAWGFWPFILGDLLKVLLAGLLIGGIWRNLERNPG